jgi:esterase
MKLFYRKTGGGQPFIILHGLFGSSDNWMTFGRELSSRFEVWIPDLRNHGRSPHSMEHNYDLMAEDLLEFMIDFDIKKPIILGHSMGGKLAINFALLHPELTGHLIVLDIAPKSYLFSINLNTETLNHKYIIETMLDFAFNGITKREQLDIVLAKSIKSLQVRQFLLKNVKRNNNNAFEWILNVKALYLNLNKILDEVNLKPESRALGVNDFPVLFIKGSDSDYILKDDEVLIKSLFPDSAIETITGAGHWIHVDQPAMLVQSICRFLNI